MDLFIASIKGSVSMTHHNLMFWPLSIKYSPIDLKGGCKMYVVCLLFT